MKKIDFSADVKTWLEFVAYDLKSARWQMKGKIYTSSCYASQQSAEKALKALLLAYGKPIPKIHSLDRLMTILKNLNIEVSSIEDEARELDKYYITTRYPGQYGGPEGLYDRDDAETAIHAVETIIAFVKRKIK